MERRKTSTLGRPRSWTSVGLLTAAVLFGTLADAQITTYSRTVLSSQAFRTFQGVPGPTTISATGGSYVGTSDDGRVVITLPFTFTYDGVGYTQAVMCSNGWVSFGADQSTNSFTAGNLFTTTTPNRTVGVHFRDLNANFGAGGGTLQHGVDAAGTGYVFQWNNTSTTSGTSSTNRLNFQLAIDGPASATPGRLTLLYGALNGTYSTGASIGIENATGGTGNYINALNGLSNSTTTTSSWPGSGNGYQFDPPTPCAGTPTPGNTTGPAFAGSGIPFNLGLQNTTNGTGVTYQWFVSTVSAGGPWTPFGTSSATVSTSQTADSWYYCEVTCSTGPSTGSSNVLAVVSIPVNTVPFTGNNSFACGTNMILRDHAGASNYGNNANGYTVLDAGVAGIINISGPYATEACCDRVRIYNGVGVGGTLLQTYNGTGTANFTGTAGQTLTVEFTSDFSSVQSGFDFVVSYSGICVPSCTQPAATVQLAPDCDANTFELFVNLSSIGDATNVDITADVNGGGATVIHDDVNTLTTYSLGTYASGDVVDVDVVHNQDNICSLALGTFGGTLTCALPGVCGLGLAVPDNTCPTTLNGLVPITAPGTQLGTDVILESVDLIIDHTFNADLEIRLTSPNNVTVDLVLDRGGSDNGLGNSANCPTDVFRLIDGGAALSTVAGNNVVGQFAPEQSLATFNDGSDPNGTWTLRVCDDAGGDLGTIQYVQLNFITPCTAPIVAGTISGTAGALCDGDSETLSLSGQSTGFGISYQWNWGTTPGGPYPNAGGTSDMENTGALATGTYYYVCDVICSFGGSATTAEYAVTVNPIPVASASSNSPVCEGNDILLDGGSSVGGSTFSWSGPNSFGSSDEDPTIASASLTDGGSYQVTATAAGCVSAPASTVVVMKPTPAAPTSSENYAICDGGSVPGGQGLTATVVPLVSSNSLAFPGSNFQSDGTTPIVRSTLNVPALPAGAVVTSAELRLFNVVATSPSFRSEIRVSLGGSYVLGATQISTLGSSGPISPDPVIALPGYALTGASTIDLLLNESFNDGIVPDAVVGSAQLVVNYTVIPTLAWYDAPTGGTNWGTGSPFDPVTAGAVNASVGGTYAFHVEAVLDGCASTREVAYFHVGNNDVSLTFVTDGAGSDITWEIVQQATAESVQSGGGAYGNNMTEVDVTCLPDGNWRLRVLDAGNNGINGGGYVLRDANGNRIIDNSKGGDGYTSLSALANNGGFGLPLGTDAVIASQCDKENFDLTMFLIASPNPAVSAQFGVNNSNSGYQFWLFDPNGSYSRRVFLSHANPMVGAPPGALAAAHLRFGNLITNPVPVDQMLNVRIRGRVNGVYGEFGPACRFMVISSQPTCPTTQLIDDPNNPNFSCGVTRTFGGSDKVVAQPVAGANLYRFRFEQIGDAFVRNITSPTYARVLNWVTSPLVPGASYNVFVQASFDGGANWCPFGDPCQVDIVSPPAASRLGTDDLSHVNLWPNPNRGDQFQLTINELPEEALTVNVDIHDLFGKRVAARTYPAQGGMLNTVVDLDGQLAAGMYVVSITAGDKLFTERLVIE